MPDVIPAAELPSPIFRHRSTAWSFVVPKVRPSTTWSRFRTCCSCAVTCLVVSRTMTGRNSIATEAIALSPDRRSRALHPCAARGTFPSLRGSERRSRSSARGWLSTARDRRSKGRRCCRRPDDTRTRWFCVKDWRRTIPGFTRLARSRRCWRKWVDGRRQRRAMRPRSMRTMACRRSRAASCCSNGA